MIHRAQHSLLAFTRLTFPEYEVNWHHKVLCDFLDKFAHGVIKRAMVFMPPRNGKSELVSRRLPAFIHGREPHAEIMAATYNATLAADMTIDVQRIIDSEEYKRIFPLTSITADSTRTRFSRNSEEHEILPYALPSGTVVHPGGTYRCQGIGGSFGGFGANYVLFDDPTKNREDADSKAHREGVYKFFTSTLRPRLEKNGSILLTMCMTGDTSVLMADGTQTPLANIRVGDVIATYENGQITTSTVKNWKGLGPDLVFAIRTSSGITVKANERHPFLVYRNGELEWVRLRDLRVNDKLMRVGENGKENYAHIVDAESLQSAKACACPTTIKPDGLLDIDRPPVMQRLTGSDISGTDMELICKSIIGSSKSKEGSALYAKQSDLLPYIGSKSSALTTATTAKKLEDCCATGATSQLNTGLQNRFFNPLLNIYEDTIIDISESGWEDVFDIQVERTENFIANGLVSHNTRWHEDDLAGRLLELAKTKPDADQWHILRFPAVRGDEICPEDPRPIGAPLWPSKYDQKWLQTTKVSIGSRDWSAIYQQDPRPEGGQVVQRSWWKFYTERPSVFDKVIQSWDLTFKKGEKTDFVVGQVWGKIGSRRILLDQFRERMTFTEQLKAVRNMRTKWPTTDAVYVEEAADGAALIDTLKGEIPGIIPVRPHGSKQARAESISPLIEAGNVELPSPTVTSWIEDYIEEWISFPFGKNDDQVDATSQALSKLKQTIVEDWVPVSFTKRSSFNR